MSSPGKYGDGGTPSLPVWITGTGGFIGNYLVQTAPQHAPNFRVVGLTRDQLDLTDFAAVRREFQKQQPQLVIHCAAISWPPVCQENPKLAWQVNLEVTKNLAGLAAEIPFVFLSTDLVFDGRKGNYIETDPVNPLSIYGETKVAAEQSLRGHPQCLILRCAINAGKSPVGNRAFNEQLHLAWRRGEMFRLFTDEFRCPIPAVVTARAVWELVAKNVPGTFHLGGAEKLSRYEIGKLLAARWPDVNPQLVPKSLKEYEGAPRAADVSMNCAKVQKLLSFALPKFSEWLAANPDKPI